MSNKVHCPKYRYKNTGTFLVSIYRHLHASQSLNLFISVERHNVKMALVFRISNLFQNSVFSSSEAGKGKNQL